MTKVNKSTEEISEEIINGISNSYSNDEKLRYLYIELCKCFSKSTQFFYDRDPIKQEEIFNNYTNIEDNEVVCRSIVHFMCTIAEKIGLTCHPIEMSSSDHLKYSHWAVEYINQGRRYLINPIPDFYRVQMGFSTQHFCNTTDYFGYDGKPFDTMDTAYIRTLDEKIGYLSSGMYTDELLEKISIDLRSRIGTHIVHTTDIYQDYYLKLLELNKSDLNIDQKLEEISRIDPEFEEHRDIIIQNLQNRTIDKNLKRIIHTLSFNSLIQSDPDLFHSREGAKYNGFFNIRNARAVKDELLEYKFNYMMNCLVNFSTPLTGYIENKDFIDELAKVVFSASSEKGCFHRHTVYSTTGSRNQYYMMFSLTLVNQQKKYCFYNPYTKEFDLSVEPIDYMIHHHIKPVKDSSLNNEIGIDYSCFESTVRKK